MKKVYVKEEDGFVCHLSNDGTMTAVETDCFDGKCDEYIEGHRAVPEGKSWTREDGEVFHGEMITPWKDSRELDEAQRAYEQDLLADAENALAILLGGETA